MLVVLQAPYCAQNSASMHNWCSATINIIINKGYGFEYFDKLSQFHLFLLFLTVHMCMYTGHLQPVSNLHFDKDSSTSTTITISWDPPFSLNLTTAEPDIQYCVDVYNVTGGGDDLECIITVESIRLLSQCLVQTTYYFHPQTDPYLQQLHCFVVTSRSNVPNATNGSQSNPVSGYIRLSKRLYINYCNVHLYFNIIHVLQNHQLYHQSRCPIRQMQACLSSLGCFLVL